VHEADSGPENDAATGGLPMELDPVVLDPGTQAALDELGEDIRAEVSALYVEDAAKRLAELCGAARLGNVAAVLATAHSLKGSSGDVGALAVRARAHAIEQGARNGTLPSAEQLQGIEAAFDEVRLVLIPQPREQ